MQCECVSKWNGAWKPVTTIGVVLISRTCSALQGWLTVMTSAMVAHSIAGGSGAEEGIRIYTVVCRVNILYTPAGRIMVATV